MNLAEFKAALQRHPDQLVRFVLPDGDAIAEHFHVTEVGLVTKNFVDCGGTVRQTSSCQLQVWLGNDEAHRLSAGKLGSILELAKSIVPNDELEVEVEYEACAISQYPVRAMKTDGNGLTFILGSKHTDCLAKEACGIEAASSCCGDDRCCG